MAALRPQPKRTPRVIASRGSHTGLPVPGGSGALSRGSAGD